MEVNVINKQKFLAELGRLLTFMYEEDRQTALAMYSKMFDDALEEQTLLQFLVSPTRQAVVLARSYDAQDRKLQVHSQSREGNYDYDGQVPPFILAILDLRQKAADLGIFAPVTDGEPEDVVDENQISLFDESAQVAPAAEEPVVDAPVPPVAAVPETDSNSGSDDVDQFANAVDAFLADFAIADGELVSRSAKNKSVELPDFELTDSPAHPQEPVAEEVEAAPVDNTPFTLMNDMDKSPVEPTAPAEIQEEKPATVRKANVFLLILYIILAIPVTLIGVCLLLIPTLICLSVAVLLVSGGVLVLTAAFGGFTIFADLMVVLGIAILVLAFGLLFTWLFIWFIGGAIVGLIRGMCHLGGNLCYKEVAVQ